MRMPKSPCAAALVLVASFFMCFVLLRFLTRQVLVEGFGMSNAFTGVVLFDVKALNEAPTDMTDWASLYPFDKESQTESASTGSIESHGILTTYLSAVDSIEARIEKYTTDTLPFRNDLVELANAYEAAVRWDYVSYSEYNGVTNLSDGYLTTVSPGIDVSEQADATIEFASHCKEMGIPFAYACAPCKVCKYEDPGVCGVTDFSNQNADDFLGRLGEAGVRTLDLREALHSEGLDHHGLFFRTDHHWLPRTGLWAAGKVVSLLEDCGVSVDASRVDPSLFREEVYREWFLSSQGKKVTLAKADPEDISLLYPTYETSLRYKVRSRSIDERGDFGVMYDMGCVSERDYYGKDPYAAYIYGNQPLEVIENEAPGLDGHVLVVHDSFGNVVVPFMSMACARVDSLDLRSFNGSLRRYIEVERPDTVIVLYSPIMLGNEDVFRLA